ncbi:hypothetical protein AC578_7872 [Pseudocercospora eumusae]|uniref:Uncharacterized protein n=1 Tax=Pseudocercospora eumusae TaxID=321146 RepID=A0A139H079_9PEZI|nr:hypothetical protein AC578_7872 [Pseudocercospora eumusae]
MWTLSFEVVLLCATLSTGHILAPYGNWTFTGRTHQTTLRSYGQYHSLSTTDVSTTCTDTSPTHYGTGRHSIPTITSHRYTKETTHYGPLSTGHPSIYCNKTQTFPVSRTSYHHKPSGYPSYPSHYFNETRPSSYSNITRTPGTRHQDNNHHSIPYTISHYSVETTTTPPAVHYSTTMRNTIPGYIADHGTPSHYMSSAIRSYDQPTMPTYYIAHTTLITTTKTYYSPNSVVPANYA